MDFTLTSEQKALKMEFSAFFEKEMKNAPPQYDKGGLEATYGSDEAFEFHREIAVKLGKKGWLSRAWPKEVGGAGAPTIEQFIFNEVRESHDAPGVDIFGIGMFAPTLIIAANDEQKKRLLTPIAKGEVMYCQGWSEPDAGSDLASLQTTAIREQDYYVINGTKIWTTGAHRADRMFLLARTDPDSKRSKGLSVFSLDMNLPGLEIRPLHYMDGKHLYNEVFFKNVRIPASNLIGKENEGWNLIRETMNFERSNVGFFVQGKNLLNEMVEYVKTTKRDGKYLAEEPYVRQKLARLFADLEIGYTLAEKIVYMQEQGGLTFEASAASEAKLFGSTLLQRIANFSTEIMGLYGHLAECKWAPLNGRMIEHYQFCMGLNIAAGSNEIQKNLISWLGLNLPRYS